MRLTENHYWFCKRLEKLLKNSCDFDVDSICVRYLLHECELNQYESLDYTGNDSAINNNCVLVFLHGLELVIFIDNCWSLSGLVGGGQQYKKVQGSPGRKQQWCGHCKVVVLGNGVRKTTKDEQGKAQVWICSDIICFNSSNVNMKWLLQSNLLSLYHERYVHMLHKWDPLICHKKYTNTGELFVKLFYSLLKYFG